jgi:hypothetical protein
MTAERSDRWLALDVFRALAVLWMIQGHTFTALLAPAHYTGAWVQTYSLLHGLTAPMFLVGAGLAYGMVANLAATPARSAALRGRLVRRALLLFAIGTALQLPAASPAGILRSRELMAGSLRLGALQLIAGCLLACELLRAIWPRHWALSSALLCAGLSLCSPWIWNAQLSQRALLGSWLDGHTGSLFPFAPWACFFLAAASFTGMHGRSQKPHAGLICGGLALSTLCYALYRAGFTLRGLYGAHAFWHTNPLFLIFRAGLVAAWLGVLCLCEPWLRRLWPAADGGGVLPALARHSLLAYVVHLLLLYGTPLHAGIARAGASWDWLETCVAFGGVLCVTLLCVWACAHVPRFSELRAARELAPRAPGGRRW